MSKHTMAIDTITIADFITLNRISIKADRVDRNPHMEDTAARSMDHWKITLSCPELREGFDTWHGYKGKLGSRQYKTLRMTIYFSKGYGHNGAEPEAEEVLSCISSDSSGIENARGFEEWCSEYGYDTDSRKAEKTFKAIEHQAARLKTFLGEELYQQLLWHTEAL